jgi:hypothetical protein
MRPFTPAYQSRRIAQEFADFGAFTTGSQPVYRP